MIEQRQTNVGIVEDGITKSVTPTTNVFYDKLGRQIAITDANGNTNSKLYNAAGQLTNDIRADINGVRL